MRTLVLIPTIGAAFAAVPAMAHDDMPRWAAGCEITAGTYQGRLEPQGEAYAKSGEAAVFWRSTLERVEPDAAKRADERAGLQKALDADLAGKTHSEQMTILSAAFAACAPLRDFAERELKSGEVKP